MADQQFELTWLRSFVALASTMSFTRAADELSMTQPAVSGHVRRLELAAGRQLVLRDTRSVSLTDNGEVMYGFARQILAAHDEAVSYFSGSAMRGRLRFGAADEFAESDLPRILRDFRELNPGINLELTVAQSGVLQRRLQSNHLDLIFINQPPDSNEGRLVGSDKLVWVGLPGTTIDAATPVPLVTYQAPSWSRSAAIGALGDVERSWRITCNTRGINGLLAAIRAGLGIGVLARSRVPKDLQILTGRLDLPELSGVEMALVDNPRSAREPVEALTRAIMNLPSATIRR